MPPLDAAAGKVPGGKPAVQLRVKSGTGFFVSPGGSLLTSAHVVAGCPAITVWPAGGSGRAARIVAADPTIDVALLSAAGAVVNYATGNPIADAPYPGEPVSTIGFGSSPSHPREARVTSGSLVGRVIDGAGNPILLFRAGLREGNSGGPVIDGRGALVGVVRGRDAQQPDLGVAVPSAAVGWFLSRHGIALIAGGPPSEQPIDPVRLLAEMSVLVQCTPGHRNAAVRPYRAATAIEP